MLILHDGSAAMGAAGWACLLVVVALVVGRTLSR